MWTANRFSTSSTSTWSCNAVARRTPVGPILATCARCSLFSTANETGRIGLDGLSLPVLRSWLSAAAAAGAARTTLARRTSAVKAFTAWAARRGLLTGDPAARLQVPKAHRTLPAVLRQDQALDAMAAAKSGAQQGDPLAFATG